MVSDRDSPELSTIEREQAVVAHEAVKNLLVNDWSAMNRDALKETEGALADSLGYSDDSPMRYQG